MNHCSLKSNPVNIQSPETRPEYILLTWTFQKSRGPNHEVQQNAQVNSFQRTYMVFVSGLWIVAKLDFRDKWSVCNLDSVSNCLQHTQRSKKGKNSTKLSIWGLIIYFFDYRSSASSTTSPSCFSPIFWRVPRSRSPWNNDTYNIVHNTLSSLKKVHFCSSHIIWGDFFHNLLFVFIFYQKKYQLSIIETILDTYFILNNSASFHFNGQTCIPYTKEKNLITH